VGDVRPKIDEAGQLLRGTERRCSTQDSDVDLVLLDLTMPGDLGLFPGTDLPRSGRKIFRPFPVVIVLPPATDGGNHSPVRWTSSRFRLYSQAIGGRSINALRDVPSRKGARWRRLGAGQTPILSSTKTDPELTTRPSRSYALHRLVTPHPQQVRVADDAGYWKVCSTSRIAY